MKVVDFRTREPIDQTPITVDEGEHHSRQQRVLKNFLIDAQALGIRWTEVRSWLLNALAYVDAKIVQQQNGKK